MALVKFDVDLNKASIFDQVFFALGELAINDDEIDPQNTFMLPVRYMKHLNFTDERYEDQYLTQICKLNDDSKGTAGKIFLSDRQARTFRFGGGKIEPITQFELPDLKTFKAPHEVILDKKLACNKLEA